MKPDLFTFLAGVAVEQGDPIPVTCNCGSVVTIMPPLQEELVVCPGGESRIKLLVLTGDPGYVMGRAPNGDPMLIPVEGSSPDKLNNQVTDRTYPMPQLELHISNRGS